MCLILACKVKEKHCNVGHYSFNRIICNLRSQPEAIPLESLNNKADLHNIWAKPSKLLMEYTGTQNWIGYKIQTYQTVPMVLLLAASAGLEKVPWTFTPRAESSYATAESWAIQFCRGSPIARFLVHFGEEEDKRHGQSTVVEAMHVGVIPVLGKGKIGHISIKKATSRCCILFSLYSGSLLHLWNERKKLERHF